MRNPFHMSRVEFLADFVVVPVLVVALVFSVHWNVWRACSVWSGFVLWTFVEYSVHRWVLHGPLLRFHGVHHRHPLAYVGVKPVYTLLTVLALMGACVGLPQVTPLVVGVLSGYFFYICVHWADHHARQRVRIGGHLWRMLGAHDLHHSVSNKYYGVSTIFWDRVFRTELKRGSF